ncbi:hypothetical protein Tco_1155722 [Tanacetum coccineum]
MCSTHTNNQITCLATKNTVHNILLVVLHLNLTFLVLHLNPMLMVPHLSSGRDTSPGPEEEAEPKTPNGLDEEAAEQKRQGPTCYPWTPKEETALCKGWVHISEDNTVSPVYNSSLLGGVKKCDKWNSGELLVFLQEREKKKNKRYKSSSSSSFNTRESGEGSINLNTTVWDEEDEVEEVRGSRPIGIDQAKRKAKAGSSAGSTNAFDVELLAKMMANEYVMASDPYNVQKGKEISELLRIKKHESKLKATELEIQRLKNIQRDEAFYEATTNEELKTIIR